MTQKNIAKNTMDLQMTLLFIIKVKNNQNNDKKWNSENKIILNQ